MKKWLDAVAVAYIVVWEHISYFIASLASAKLKVGWGVAAKRTGLWDTYSRLDKSGTSVHFRVRS